MNERIKELILEAGWENAYTNPNEGFELIFVDEDHTLKCVKKFSELIIQECAMVVEGFQFTAEVALDEYVDYEASNVLKEHFSVE
jgi:hypothetical protein